MAATKHTLGADSQLRGRAAVEFRESRGRAYRRNASGDAKLLMCSECKTEIDVRLPKHDTGCSHFVAPPVAPAARTIGSDVPRGDRSKAGKEGDFRQRPDVEKTHRADGSLTAAEQDRQHRHRMTVKVLCGIDGCEWEGWEGPSDEGPEVSATHRAEAHPDWQPPKKKRRGNSVEEREKARSAVDARVEAARQADLLARMDAGESVKPKAEPTTAPPAPEPSPEPAPVPAPLALDRVSPKREGRGRIAVYSRESVVESLRRWAADHDGYAPRQDDWKLAADGYPTSDTVRRTFEGSWAKACEAAGLEQRPKTQRATNTDQRVWPEARIIEAILADNERLGRAPLAVEWRATTDEHPSERTVRKVFGSFSAGVEAAGLEANPQGRTKAAMERRSEGASERETPEDQSSVDGSPVPEASCSLASPETTGKIHGGRSIAFLYTLLRDHIAPGVLNGILEEFDKNALEVYSFSDPFLAMKAIQLNARVHGMTKAEATDLAYGAGDHARRG